MKSPQLLRLFYLVLWATATLALLSSCDLSPGTSPDAALDPVPGPNPSTAVSRIIDYRNFDPSIFTDSLIQKAAALDVYFEHASVGNDIVGDSVSNTSQGTDSAGSKPCGLALLYTQNSRYLTERSSWSASGGASWFASHNGIVDNHRGNPSAEDKLSGFVSSMTPQLAAAVDVAMFKFCWIDTPTSGATLFTQARTAMESLEASYPSVSFVWWTMPIGCEAAEVERQAYNDLVRAYCAEKNAWLLDIASLESHDDSGLVLISAGGIELMQAAYAIDAGGDNHLNQAGKNKLAKAWWTLMARIADSQV